MGSVVGGLFVIGSPTEGTAGTKPAVVQPAPSSTGRFIVHCQPSARGAVDLIRVPGTVGVSHAHDFFGPWSLPSRTTADLGHRDHSCSASGDRSAYWVPVLLLNKVPVPASRAQAYYQVNDLTRPFPAGFAAVIGSSQHKPGASASSGSTPVTWICGGTGADRTSTRASTCRTGEFLMAAVQFPGCSNGSATSADLHSHVAYADPYGRCPASHPRHIPQLTLYLQWSCNVACGPRRGWSLSAGDTAYFHADFASGWVSSELRKLILRCNSTDCGVIGILPGTRPVTSVN